MRAPSAQPQDGGPSAHLGPGCQHPDVARKLSTIQTKVLQRYGGTGVLAAVTAAASLRLPAVAFPVADLESCAALPATTLSSGAGGMIGSGQDAKVGGWAGAETPCGFVEARQGCKLGELGGPADSALQWWPQCTVQGSPTVLSSCNVQRDIIFCIQLLP